MSKEANRKVWFFQTGPPKLPAASLRRNTPSDRPLSGFTVLWKMLRDDSTLSWWNQDALPWKSFVPDLVATLTCAPASLPEAAEKLLTVTWTSWMDSVLG